MKTRQVIVHNQHDVRLDAVELDHDEPHDHELLIRTRASFISAGTELAIYTGLNPQVSSPVGWCRYPASMGYANVGEVVAVGQAVDGFSVGERVFTLAHHVRDHLATVGQNLVVPVPENLTDAQAVAARMAMVAIAAVQVADLALNEWVAVFGLGTVGNLAAQLFRLSGARVIGIDPYEPRRRIAEKAGIEHVIGGSEEEVATAIQKLTGNVGARIAIDAVGDSRVVHQAAQNTATYGQVILLGTPRAEVQANVTDTIWPVHYRWIKFIGAHEWRLPLVHRPCHREDLRHSVESNLVTIYDLIERGCLRVDDLISHQMRPEQIEDAYEGLLNHKDTYWGVVLDWSQVA